MSSRLYSCLGLFLVILIGSFIYIYFNYGSNELVIINISNQTSSSPSSIAFSASSSSSSLSSSSLSSSSLSSSSSSSLSSSSSSSTSSTSSSPLSSASAKIGSWLNCNTCNVINLDDCFCDKRKFVMMMNVTSEMFFENNLNNYKIKVIKVLKRSPLFVVIFRRNLISLTSNLSYCKGFHLVPNRTYLVTGSINGLNVLLNECDIIIDWNSLSHEVQHQIEAPFTPRIDCSSHVDN